MTTTCRPVITTICRSRLGGLISGILSLIGTICYRVSHLLYSFYPQLRLMKKEIVPASTEVEGCPPPYVLTSRSIPKRRTRKNANTDNNHHAEKRVYEVDTYSLPYMGPYPSDIVRVNAVRYTPAQGRTNLDND